MQIFLPWQYLPANSISEITGIPFAFIVLISGAVSGIPGLLITSLARNISFSE
jgi:hypothetical protein